MLELVRELAAEMGVEAAWHTGSVPQQRRRAEIIRFKKDPACRLFLSTDSGSVGLNLQAASAVVNVDLPWNPARLEQRIARAWRKHQTRSVTVVNLVCENSIEHSILHIIGQKQALADGLIDGQGDIGALKMPNGRAAMIERMQAMMQAAAPRIVSADEALAQELQRRHGERALLIEARPRGDGRLGLLVVLDLAPDALAAEAERLAAAQSAGGAGLAVELIDRATWAAMRRLQASGVLALVETPGRVLHRAPGFAEPQQLPGGPAARAEELRVAAERTLRMARVLASGGFPEETPPLIAKAIGQGAAARLSALGELPDGIAMATPVQIRALVERNVLPPQAVDAMPYLSTAATPSGAEVDDLLEAAAQVLAACAAGGTAAALPAS
jgi:hypothetical protein